MSRITGIVISGIVLSMLSGCAEMQVKRDLAHAAAAQQYRSNLADAVPLDPARSCTLAPEIGVWRGFAFVQSSPVYKLPGGESAEAVCLRIPQGARAMEYWGDATGGSTFYQLTLVHPSYQFLDDKYELVQDIRVPRMSARDHFFSGIGLSAITVLTGGLQRARYVLVYVNPDSLDGALDVHTNGATIPVPYSPYGSLKIRFVQGG